VSPVLRRWNRLPKLARVEIRWFLIRRNAMSSINGLGAIPPLQQTQNITGKTAIPETAQPSATDRLELSGASNFLQTLKTNDIRTDKVAAVKAQIADGSYDADGSKLDAAVGKLLDSIT
jgi:anti-sigma28 factor (negative regulator of flagellin synthesis)